MGKDDWMNLDALRDNICYVLKEGQMKIGYTENAASLNYPPASLSRLLEVGETEVDDALRAFCDFAAPTLGRVSVGVYDGQYCLTIPKEGVRYVHENVPESPFLRELIDAVKNHTAHTVEQIEAVFRRYSDDVVCKAVEGEGFDHVLYFADGRPDGFVYLFETDFGHVSYHRMTKADYEAEIE